MRAVFDTGSTNAWILDKNTDTGSFPKKYSYNPEASTTKHKTNLKADFSFGIGNLGGTFYTDDIRLGNCKDSKG